MTSLTRRSLLGGAALLAVGTLAACSSPSDGTATMSPRPRSTATLDPSLANGVGFASGSSCIGAANGDFGAWRGKTSAVSATWAANGGLQQLQGEYRSWTGSIDYAPQYETVGDTAFSWSALASGAFDRRLAKDLKALHTAWGDRTGVVNYRFQHEFNGDWFAWAVSEATVADFVAGWKRFARLFRAEFADDPRFRLVWSPNGGSAPKKFQDIRSAWPGDDAVDVIGVDYYDFDKPQDLAAWKPLLVKKDDGGGPVGLTAWREFAMEHGTPLALPEWGNQYGDNPFFVEAMYDFIETAPVTTATAGGGELLYEVYFNQRLDKGTPSTSGDFRLQQSRRDLAQRPKAAAAYRDLWGTWNLI